MDIGCPTVLGRDYGCRLGWQSVGLHSDSGDTAARRHSAVANTVARTGAGRVLAIWLEISAWFTEKYSFTYFELI